jgi:hypothetical protein
MLINVKIFFKKKFLTDGRTDRRTTQNYSSEPHKIIMHNIKYEVTGGTQKISLLHKVRLGNFMLIYVNNIRIN